MTVGEKKNEILGDLYETVIKHGKLSNKPNNIDSEDNVYTRKIALNIDLGNNVVAKYLSLTSMNKEFKNTYRGELRLATQNENKKWMSMFINQVSYKTIKKLYDYIINKYKK